MNNAVSKNYTLEFTAEELEIIRFSLLTEITEMRKRDCNAMADDAFKLYDSIVARMNSRY